MPYTVIKIDESAGPIPGVDSMNRELSQSCRLSFASLYNQQVGSYGIGGGGDPDNGKVVAGIRWEDTTEPQSMIVLSFGAAGQELPANIAEILALNKGPNEPPYFSYAQWGLVQGEAADPSIKVATVLQSNGSHVVAVTGILQP